MLPQINRIKKKKDFELVFKGPKAVKIIPIAARMVNNNLSVSRFGIIVSQKVSKKAVIRNKVRRRISESIKGELRDIKTGADVAIVTLPGVDKLEFIETKELIKKILIKLKLIK